VASNVVDVAPAIDVLEAPATMLLMVVLDILPPILAAAPLTALTVPPMAAVTPPMALDEPPMTVAMLPKVLDEPPTMLAVEVVTTLVIEPPAPSVAPPVRAMLLPASEAEPPETEPTLVVDELEHATKPRIETPSPNAVELIRFAGHLKEPVCSRSPTDGKASKTEALHR
jgi:hypothetical protein